MAYIDDVESNVRETVRKFGAPPLLGTFAPERGDIARNESDEYLNWTGVRWVPLASGVEQLIRKSLADL